MASPTSLPTSLSSSTPSSGIPPPSYIPPTSFSSSLLHKSDRKPGLTSQKQQPVPTHGLIEADLSFAAKIQVGDSIPQFTLISADKMKHTIPQSFPHVEEENSDSKPFQLYVHVVTDSPVDHKDTSGSKCIGSGAPLFSEEILSFFSKLIFGTTKEEPSDLIKSRRVVSELITTIFHSIHDIIPSENQAYDSSSQKKSKQSKGFLSRLKSTTYKVETIPTVPILLICSQAAHVFPWELLLPGEVIARYFSLKHVLAHKKYIKAHHKTDVLLPDLYAPTPIVIDKTTERAEQTRRQHLVKLTQHDLSLHNRNPSREKSWMYKILFHTPYIKTKKKRNIKYYDLGLNSDLLVVADNAKLGGLQYSVFLFTYADLLELPQSLWSLIRERVGCTLLFIPGVAFKAVCLKLLKSQQSYQKSTLSSSRKDQTNASIAKDLYHYLVSEALTMQEELCVPIVIVNPPASD